MTNLTNLIANAKLTNTNVASVDTTIATKKEVTMDTTKTKMNAQAKASLITQQLFNKGLTARESVVVASAFMSIEDELVDNHDQWEDNMIDAVYNTILTVDKVESTDMLVDGWKEALVAIDLVTSEGAPGKYLLQLNTDKELAHARPATQPITAKTRRKNTIKNGVKLSPLSRKTLSYLQRNERTISTEIYDLAVSVFSGWKECDEQYILDGAFNQISLGNVPSVNEYFFDTRVRIYQGDAHGGNVQASDMARAMVSPCHVSLDYDVDAALVVLKAEAADMVKGDVDKCIATLATKDPVEFMRAALSKGTMANKVVKKPWSFYKISQLIIALEVGEKPYLDVTVGLDAKCSGPQLGALMVGDNKLAAACGFSTTVVQDAYERCIVMLENVGFIGLDRNLMKKPFMGVFYGQGWMAYSLAENYAKMGQEPNKRQHAADLLPVLLSIGADLEANAKTFHKIIEKSFGAKLSGVRQLLKDSHYHYEMEGESAVRIDHCVTPTSYFLPDGQKVATQYFIQEDINGEELHGENGLDVHVKVGFIDFKFNMMTFKTKEYDMYAYARTGFVNFIQSMDGLLARLIISKLEDLGATLVDSVHDCFRVTVVDMIDGKLDNAIKFAYNSLFACDTDCKTFELPNGTDALKMYFEGVNRACTDDYKLDSKTMSKTRSQFQFSPVTGTCVRKLKKTGMNVGELINDLGNTYYFAK